ncbi:MAG TPA: sigma 54-interacting transcriptional regulator, partial [Vicinamibacterales bacterium]
SDVVGQVAALLDESTGAGSRPAVVTLTGPPASGKSTAMAQIAREARVRGYVPVCVALLAAHARAAKLPGDWKDHLAGRHLLVIDDPPADAQTVARALVVASAISARAHVIVTTGLRAGSGAVLELTRLPALWLDPQRVARLARAGRAAETATVYQSSSAPRDVEWDSGLDRATALSRAGRHAAAERQLRRVMAMAVRRRGRTCAGEGAVLLGKLLLQRGRAVDAARHFDEARRWFDGAGKAEGCVAAAVWFGLALADDGHLREAEATLKQAVAAAERMDAAWLAWMAHLALARCLFWQARYADARLTLDHVLAGESAVWPAPQGVGHARLWNAGDAGVLAHALAARIALGERQPTMAAAQARAAMERAALTGDSLDGARAHLIRALVEFKCGDMESVATHAAAGRVLAARARAPLTIVRLRVLELLATAILEPPRARRLHDQLIRISRRLPGLLQAHVLRACRHASHASSGPLRSTEHEERFIMETGARALPLIDAPDPVREAEETRRAGTGEHLLDLLELCRRADDEHAALTGAAGFVRERLNASAVGVFARAGEQTYPVAWTGSRAPTTSLAQRAADLGQTVPPAPAAGGTEMAVPVTCGEIVGAVTCRWTVDARVDAGAAGELLQAVAAALALHVRLAGEALQPRAPDVDDPDLVGDSVPMRELRGAIARAARTPFSVLVEGESGCGKELVARAIHRLGPRRLRRFCSFNCAALPDDLLEAELFGHARGAFTGAVAERPGLFEQADGGTLLMDEVGELSPRAQAKLLRVLQEGEIRRLGDVAARHVDVRIVAATNRSLREESAEGRFRRDLLYRLDVIRIPVPPLRDRPDDIPLLAAHFWRDAAQRTGTHATLAPATVAALARYDWPGNVRELQNVLSALAATAPPRGRVTADALPASLLAAPGGRLTLDEARRAFDARFVRMALARAGGRRTRAAQDLGLTRQGLAKLIDRLGIATEGAEGGSG